VASSEAGNGWNQGSYSSGGGRIRTEWDGSVIGSNADLNRRAGNRATVLNGSFPILGKNPGMRENSRVLCVTSISPRPRAIAAIIRSLGPMAGGVQFPMTARVMVWGVEDGPFEELIIHASMSPF
jgi:hypothetical protein